MGKYIELYKKYGLDLFVLLLILLMIASILFKIGEIFKILFAGILAWVVLIIIGDKLEEAFRKYGLEEYYRTITLLGFILIGWWNWLALMALLIVLFTWYLVK